MIWKFLFCHLCLFTFKNLIRTCFTQRQGHRYSNHTQGEIQGPLESVGALPLELNSLRKPTEQKTPNLNGSTYLALSVCSALLLVGKCFIVPWKCIMRNGVGGRGELCCCQLSPWWKGFLQPSSVVKAEGRPRQGPGRVSHRNSVPQSETCRNFLK